MLQQKRKIMVTTPETGEYEEFTYLHMEDRISSAGDMYYNRYRLKDKDGHILECKEYYAIDDGKNLFLKNRKLANICGPDEGGIADKLKYMQLMLFLTANSLYLEIVDGTRTGSPKLPLPSPQELMDEFLDKLEEEIGTALEYGLSIPAENIDLIRYELECKYDYLPREQRESVQHSAEKE